MKKALIIVLCLFALVFVSCNPEQEEPQQGQGGGQGGGGSEPKAKYNVTFVQEGQDPIVREYEEGDPLYLYAPDLPYHSSNIFGNYYNWDTELDWAVTSNKTVTRTDNQGHAVFFMNKDEHAVKIIAKKAPASWTTLSVNDFPALPTVEGYVGVWEQTESIEPFSDGRMDVTCWYYSSEKYSSTGMPKSFIIYGGEEFTISEYPINVSGTTLTYINATNFAPASNGQTAVNSDEVGIVINGVSSNKTAYENMSYVQKSDWLVQNLSENARFINAIKVMRQTTNDNGWSIPTARYCNYIARALLALQGEGNYYSYLSNGLSQVKFVNTDDFFQNSNSVKFMIYSYVVSGYGAYRGEWNFGSGSLIGYLWPIKPVE